MLKFKSSSVIFSQENKLKVLLESDSEVHRKNVFERLSENFFYRFRKEKILNSKFPLKIFPLNIVFNSKNFVLRFLKL